MPEPALRSAYLQRLDAALPLPDAARAATVEEIAAHLEMVTDSLIARGLPGEVAERRALERLGAPERLADDIAASHRQPSHALAAAGTALRVSLVTSFQVFVLAWAAVFVLALFFGLAVAGIRRLVGTDFLQTDWSPLLDGLLPALISGLIAWAVGRSVVGPVARAARRRPAQVRLPLLVIGLFVTTIIGLTAIEARWSVWTAALMATLPAWFALGVLRPNLVPNWGLPRWSFVAVVGVLVSGSALIFFAGGAVTSGGSVASAPYDPNEEYASVGQFVSPEHPPVELAGDGTSAGPWRGSGPLRVERTGTIRAGFADEWTSVRLEVWPGPVGELNGPALDPTATEPLASAPMVIDGHRISGDVALTPLPDREHYYVAITGMNADGRRWQLAWPGVEFWQWHGTPLARFLAEWR